MDQKLRVGYYLTSKPHEPIPFECEEENLIQVQMKYCRLYTYILL